MIARVARVILLCHAAAYAQERTNNAFGVFEQRLHQPIVTGVGIAAPHGTYDSNTAPIAVEAAQLLGAGYVTGQRFVAGRVRKFAPAK